MNRSFLQGVVYCVVSVVLISVMVINMNRSNIPKKSEQVKSGYICTFTEKELKARLSPEQYRVMRQNGTELPFKNKYWDNHQKGIYVDAITGEPLFASSDKFDSKSGWPSFTRPIRTGVLMEKEDLSHGMVRMEVRSKSSDSHLGHVFDDGPDPTGLRYCINSVALRFVPLEDMEEEGYSGYIDLFEGSK